MEIPSSKTEKLRFLTPKEERSPVFAEPGILDQQTFRGVRQLTPASAMLLDDVLKNSASLGQKNRGWSDAELEAAISEYLTMLELQNDGISFIKADMNRRLREGAIRGRSRQSIDCRMRNISAVLVELGQPYVQGYVSAKNVGEGVKNRIMKLQQKIQSDFPPTADQREFDRKVRALRKRKIRTKPKGVKKPSKAYSSGTQYSRDPAVKAWILDEADGACEQCSMPAPFLLPGAEPYLEEHHVLPLAEKGSDTITNAVALCPNCHRRCHHGEDKKDFAEDLYAKVPRLIKESRRA